MNRTPYDSKSEIDNIELLAFARDNRDSDGGIAWRKWTPTSQKDGARSKYQRLMRHHGFGDGDFTVDNTDEVLRYYESLEGRVASEDSHPVHTPTRETNTSSESVTGEVSSDEEERLLNQAGLDSGRWEVGPFWKRISDEESVMFKPKGESLDTDEFQGILDQIKQHSPHQPPYSFSFDTAERYMFEIGLVDPHLGLLSWEKETGESWDLDIAQNVVLWAIDYLLKQIEDKPIEKIVLPLGNDLLHADQTDEGKGGKTNRGTPQDMDSRWPKMVDYTFNMMRQAIDKCQEVAPVILPWVPGNHDFERSYQMAKTIWAYYYNNERVTVDTSPTSQKFVEYGNNFIGFEHGKNLKPEAMPRVLMREAIRRGVQAEFLEFHCGDLHKKKDFYMPVDEENGVRVRFLPSLVANDSWHAMKGYEHQRSAEGYLWSHENGLESYFPANLTRNRLNQLIYQI